MEATVSVCIMECAIAHKIANPLNQPSINHNFTIKYRITPFVAPVA